MAEPKTADEIAHIEHELAILRERLARFIYWGGVLRIVVPAGGIVIVLLLIAIVIKGFTHDPLITGFVLCIICIVLALFWFVARGTGEHLREIGRLRVGKGWTDLASPRPDWSWGNRYVSEAHAIEEMIVEREARLAALRGIS